MVLRSRLRPDPFPLALQQARAALDALQRSLLQPVADPDRIGVVGSSAAGLLAALTLLPREAVTALIGDA